MGLVIFMFRIWKKEICMQQYPSLGQCRVNSALYGGGITDCVKDGARDAWSPIP